MRRFIWSSLVSKRKSGFKVCAFALISQGREGGGDGCWRPVSRGLRGRRDFVSDGWRRCCVRPMCVSEDKNRGQPSVKDGRTHLRFMKEGCQKVISKVLQQRLGGRERAESERTSGNQAGRRKSWHPPTEKAGSAANKQHGGCNGIDNLF